MIPDWLGYSAGVCTTLAFLPQALKVWRTRSTGDISGSMYAVFLTGLVLWLAYGLVLRAWPVVIANALTLLLAGSILVMKWRFEMDRPRA